jgi:hypothetical protein
MASVLDWELSDLDIRAIARITQFWHTHPGIVASAALFSVGRFPAPFVRLLWGFLLFCCRLQILNAASNRLAQFRWIQDGCLVSQAKNQHFRQVD